MKKPRKESNLAWYVLVGTIFFMLMVLTWSWMNQTDYLNQKYICPCFNYYKNESTGYYEATRVVSCQCLNIDIQDAKACSPVSDTECRNVSNDRLVCDELVMENR